MCKLNKCLCHIVLLALIAIFYPQAGYAESLYVFYPITQRPHVLRTKMSEACPDIEISVFGRYQDFERQVRKYPPDAILSKAPSIRQIGGYSIKLRGTRGQATDEPYVLVSVDEKADPGNIAGKAVGMVGILDRKGMKKFVGRYFRQPPRLNRVLKIEDLLGLLSLKMAKAVLVPEHDVSYFKKRSRMSFVITPVPDMRIEIIALALKQGSSASATVSAVRGMDEKIKALLGIDSWE